MAHRIQNRMMAYRSVKPWHTEGNQADAATLANLALQPINDQVEYWLNLARMNFQVQRRMLAMRPVNSDGTPNRDHMLTEELAGYRAIVRSDTNYVYQVATAKYHPMQNADILRFFCEYASAGNAVIETVGAIDNGCKVWALAKLNGEMSVGENDKSQSYLLMATSHDGSLRTIGKPTTVYVVCWNTLSMSLGEKSDSTFSMKHSKKWSSAVAEQARKKMGMALESANQQNEVANKLARVSLDAQGQLEYVNRLLGGETILEQIAKDSATGSLDDIINATENAAAITKTDLNRVGAAIIDAMLYSPGQALPERNNTLWGAVNGVTYYVDHERGRTADNRLSSAWFGDGDKLKTQAMELACEIAGVN